MSRYFFLASILPSLSVGSEPEILFEDLVTLYRDNLNRKDFEKVRAIRTYIDLKNVQKVLKEEPLDHRGDLNEKQLDEAIVNQEGLPSLLFDFFEEYQETSEQLRHYSKVFIAYFRKMEKEERGFLKDYFRFEREWRVVLAGYRAKRLRIDPIAELQHEDFHDPLVAEVLAQKDGPYFEFPFEYMELGETLKTVGTNPDEHYRLMADFRFNSLQKKIEDHPFSIDYLLGYLAQLMIVEDAFALDDKRGSAHLKEMVKSNL